MIRNTSTYSFLSKAELARTESEIETQEIIDDGVADDFLPGTGFMVAENSFCPNSGNKLFAHKVDTITGQSGAPVYKNGIQGLTCYGIHVTGNSTENTAGSITADVYNLLVDVIR